MSLVNTLLNAVSANGTGPVVDLGQGNVSDTLGVQIVLAGGTPTFSIQLQGSLDGVNFTNVGSAIAAAGLTRITGIAPCEFFRAVLSSYAGSGTITAIMSALPLA